MSQQETTKIVETKKATRATKPVRLVDYLHRQLKMEAASQEKTASKLLEEAVIEHFGFSSNHEVEVSLKEINKEPQQGGTQAEAT